LEFITERQGSPQSALLNCAQELISL